MTNLTLAEMSACTEGRWLVPPSSDTLVLQGVSIDTRALGPGHLFVALQGQQSDGHSWLQAAAEAGASAALVEEGRLGAHMPEGLPLYAVSNTQDALWDLARAWRQRLNVQAVGITGSAGKTTVRRMLEAILTHAHTCGVVGGCTASERSFNNHLGVPLTILRARLDDQFLVLEIGTNAPGEIAQLAGLARPDLAVITNIGRVHLEGLGSLAGVAEEKASLLSVLTSGQQAIVPTGPPVLQDAVARHLSPDAGCVTFGQPGADVVAIERTVLDQTGAQQIRLEDGFSVRLRLPGGHNAQNALAAITAARSLDIADSLIAEALGEMESDPMRFGIEELGASGIMIYNDAYNSNPDAVLASLQAFAEMSGHAPRRIVILGDMLELGDDEQALHEEVGRALAQVNQEQAIDVVILVGHRSLHTGNALAECGFSNLIVRVPELHEALLESIAALVSDGDAVLVKGSRGMALERLVEMVRTKNLQPLEPELAENT